MNDFGSLYGISHTNRRGTDLWGKNQFNSTFPTALACYMRDNNFPVVYLCAQEDLSTQCRELNIDQLFNTDLPNEKLFFEFEAKYEPYQDLVYGSLERVDLIVRKVAYSEARDGSVQYVAGDYLRPLEVKLTVVPDSATYGQSDPREWAPEIVIRPATSMYCALSIASNVPREDIKSIFLKVGNDVVDWGNQTEAQKILPRAIEAINELHAKFHSRQQPLVMQPIWRTMGKQPILDENAFDIFVWSDFALSRVFTDLAVQSGDLVRYGRSVLRLTRYLYEYGRAGGANISNIYSSMTYNQQSDKEFSINGKVTKKYLTHPRMGEPLLPKDVIKSLILNGGQRHLSPERRFDQTIYFTYQFED